jgi:membrane associated rhomboid family serine protease
VGGNMLFLWIFGNNIEDTLGHFKFVVFYLLSGLSAVYAHAFTEPGSVAPMIGASGAVSGVLAAYMVLYPRARVYTIILLGFFVQVVKVPALMYIGIWAIIQIVNGLYLRGMQGAGVAWFAHVGGFLFGLAAIKLFRPKRRGG